MDEKRLREIERSWEGEDADYGMYGAAEDIRELLAFIRELQGRRCGTCGLVRKIGCPLTWWNVWDQKTAPELDGFYCRFWAAK